MDAQQFLAEFGHVANAPGGVTRLRELVLFLAVRGELVARLPVDHARVAKIRLGLDHSKTLERRTRFRVLEPVAAPDAPYPVTDGWMWARLGELVEVLDGLRQPITKSHRKPGQIPYYGASGIVDYIAEHIFDEDLVLVGEDGARWGRGEPTAFKISGKSWVNNHVHVLRPNRELIADDYLVIVLTEMELSGFITGMTVPKLNQQRLISIPIPLPPTEEQSRIVAKVDELMALCDLLEKQQQDRRKLQNAMRQSTLQALASAENPHELHESWQRLQANFGQLVFEPGDVDDVIAELKNLAVRGHLEAASAVPVDMVQIKSDCSELRAKYIASGVMRRQKLVGPAENDVGYPEHWGVTSFDEVAVVIGGVTKGRNLRGKKTLACPYLSVANVQRGYFKLASLKSIEIAEDELTKYAVHEGDLLITEGGDWDKVGRTAIWRGGVPNCLHQNHVFKARVPSDHLLNEWVELVFNSGVGRDYFAGASKQTTNLASINMTQLRGFPLPVPPLDEQRRILKKLADLTAQCNAWRDQLDKKVKLSALLANAVVAGLTGMDFEQQEEAVKAPQTELIAPLRLCALPDVKDQAPLATLLARHQGEMSARDLWQRFGGEIDDFYAQLKTEVAHGWITEPPVAQVRTKTAETAAG
ncbi:MAG: restriction endonuclease subunit S [Rhizobacter sp.]|nr:restriction endonuclease subunit S [Rhizobacter sp.]